MKSIQINKWNKNPELAAIVRATFPDYKRHKVSICLTDTVTLHDLNWSGGTKSEYKAVSMTLQPIGSSNKYSHMAPWVNYAEGMTIPLPADAVIVQGGVFCGKPSMLTIYLNPGCMPLLPSVRALLALPGP